MVGKNRKSQAMIEKFYQQLHSFLFTTAMKKQVIQNIDKQLVFQKEPFITIFNQKMKFFFAVLKQRYQLMEKRLLDWLESTSHLTGREQLKEIFQFSSKSQKTNYEMLNHALLMQSSC